MPSVLLANAARRSHPKLPDMVGLFTFEFAGGEIIADHTWRTDAQSPHSGVELLVSEALVPPCFRLAEVAFC